MLVLAASVLAATGCVSNGKYKAMQQQADKNDSLYTWSQRTLKVCQDNNADLRRQKTAIQDHANDLDLQLTATKENVTLLRHQVKDLSTLSSAQAETIKRSLDNMGAKDAYLMELRSEITSRDSANLVMLMDLKGSIGGYGEQNLTIKVEKGAVSIECSDSLLYNPDTTSTTLLSSKAKAFIGRLARVLNDHPQSTILVEGSSAAPGPIEVIDTAAVLQNTPVASTIQADSTIHVDSTVHVDNIVHVDSAAHTDSATTDSAKATTTISANIDTNGLSIDSAAAARLLRASNAINATSAPAATLPPANWQLAVNRSATLVHMLETDFHVASQRLTAAGSATINHTRITIRPSTDRLEKTLDHGPGRK